VSEVIHCEICDGLTTGGWGGGGGGGGGGGWVPFFIPRTLCSNTTNWSTAGLPVTEL